MGKPLKKKALKNINFDDFSTHAFLWKQLSHASIHEDIIGQLLKKKKKYLRHTCIAALQNSLDCGQIGFFMVFLYF
jgi:7-keto-8-aminopelargonate synthetase-like enzyme